jgi:hypothetical protein
MQQLQCVAAFKLKQQLKANRTVLSRPVTAQIFGRNARPLFRIQGKGQWFYSNLSAKKLK